MASQVMKESLMRSLSLATEWYKRMIAPNGLLAYQYDPKNRNLIQEQCEVRDLGNVWDVAMLQQFMGKRDFDYLVERSIRYHRSMIVRKLSLHPNKSAICYFDSKQIKEPANIAHNAMMVMALSEFWKIRQRRHQERDNEDGDNEDKELRALIEELCEGIVQQQREDGSYRIYFDQGIKDHGIEFYPAEAMLGLMKAHDLFPRKSWLGSVELAVPYYRTYWHSVPEDLQIFFVNWQTQVARTILRHSTNPDSIREIRQFVKQMHDRVIDLDFYAHLIGRRSTTYSTVEVACALEGVADALGILSDEIREKGHAVSLEHDKNRYQCAINMACSFLIAVQERQRNHPVAYGGFGHRLDNSVQRLDVTGHVVNGFIKVVSLLNDPTLSGGLRLAEPHVQA